MSTNVRTPKGETHLSSCLRPVRPLLLFLIYLHIIAKNELLVNHNIHLFQKTSTAISTSFLNLLAYYSKKRIKGQPLFSFISKKPLLLFNLYCILYTIFNQKSTKIFIYFIINDFHYGHKKTH